MIWYILCLEAFVMFNAIKSYAVVPCIISTVLLWSLLSFEPSLSVPCRSPLAS
jgi:hypothetical protein